MSRPSGCRADAIAQAGLSQLELVLLRAEAAIDLVGAMTPTNLQEQRTLHTELLTRGASLPGPEFRYRPPRDMDAVQRALDTIEDQLARLDSSVERDLLVERTRELRLEGELVAMRGTAHVLELSKQRFRLSADEQTDADELARTWLVQTEPDAEHSQSRTSLSHALASLSHQKGLSIPIREADIAARAAVSERGLVVRRGYRAAPQEARRIFVHEVEGHWLPRQRALSEGAPFRIGTRGASDDEEGRAILLEHRAGLLDPARGSELAARHVACTMLRGAAASSEETYPAAVEHLINLGCPPLLAVTTALRASRGGGLCREVIYLSGFLRVSSALTRAPALESWLERGRIAISAAQRLEGSSGSRS